MSNPWVLFNGFVLAMLALDLGVFHRKAHTVTIREALAWSVVWVLLAMGFNAWLYFDRGGETALQFLTGYLIEKSLSVDNIFIFVLIFSFFKIPAHYQHRILFWGILGALAMRAAMIVLGAALIAKFHWIIYLFGAFLVVTGLRMMLERNQHAEPGKNFLVRLVARMIPLTPKFDGGKFLVRINGVRHATPCLLALVTVELTDLIFAVDSIPAIFAVTTDPFIVYTSNVFAILGLRSLYFALAGLMDKFHYLKAGLALVLMFVGTKMLIMDLFKIPAPVALGVVGGILTTAVLTSLLHPKAAHAAATQAQSPE